MSTISPPSVQQITPGVGIVDYEAGKFVDLGNGTASPGTIIPAVRITGTVATSGASGYAEGTTVGTATGNVVIFRGTGGTTTAVGTASPLPVQEQFAPVYEDNTVGVAKVEQRYSYYNVAGTGAFQGTVKSGAGFIHTLVMNKAVASGTTTLYDSIGTSATQIAQIVSGGTILSDMPLTATYNVSFTTGLTIVTSGAQNVTISWR